MDEMKGNAVAFAQACDKGVDASVADRCPIGASNTEKTTVSRTVQGIG